MAGLKTALEHIGDAELALISHISDISRLSEDAADEDIPDSLPVLFAVLRSISRAAGILDSNIDSSS